MKEFILTIYWELLPMLLQLIGAILGVLLIRAANVARERWGIEIEARHREALHSALMTGITAAFGKQLRGKEAVVAAVNHVLGKGAPDAVDFFGLGWPDLENMVEAKLRQSLPFFDGEIVTAVQDVLPKAPLQSSGGAA